MGSSSRDGEDMTNQGTMTEDLSHGNTHFEPAQRFYDNHQPHHSISPYNGEYIYAPSVYHPYPAFQMSMPMTMPIQFPTSMQNPAAMQMHIGRAPSMSITAPQLNHSQLTETNSSTTGSPNSNATYISASEDTKVTDRKPKKKPGIPVPEEKKDEAYRAKRVKNNISAQRSREAKRLRSASVEAEITDYRHRIAQAKERICSLTQQRALLEEELHAMGMNQGRQV